jgi:isoprenylcysteine carboxyl methyltransferase (ICMT) family protein YpbQ
MERQLTGLYLTFIGSGTRMTSSDSTIRDASPTTGSIPRSASASPADLAICWIGAFAVAATLYIATMAPGVLWGDSGDAQARLLNRLWRDPRDLARAHVSYYAVGWLVQVVTGRTAAWSANLVAALAGAATVAHVAVATRLLTVNRLAAGAAALLLMLSHTLWQLSCGAEVVTFSTMCLAGEMALLILLIRTQRLEFAVTLALVNGIGWTTHNLAMLTWPVYALLIIQHRRTVFGCGPRAIAVVAAAWLAGCAPLLVMTVSACLEASSVGETLRSLLVGRYAPQVFHHEVTSGGLLRVGGYVLMNFPTPLLVLAPWGWWALRDWSRAVWMFVTLAGLAYFVFAGRYHVADQYTFMVHAYLFLVICTAIGVDRLLAWKRSRALATAVVLACLLAPVAYILGPGWVGRVPVLAAQLPQRELPYRDAATWFLRPWRMNDDGAERFARELLAELPANAIALADSVTRSPLDYVQAEQQLRMDVQVSKSLWRDPATVRRVSRETIAQLVADELVYTTTDEPRYLPAWLDRTRYGFEPVGLAYRVVLRSDDSTTSVSTE